MNNDLDFKPQMKIGIKDGEVDKFFDAKIIYEKDKGFKDNKDLESL